MTTLVIAAHPDDEALGCGGTLKKISARGEDVRILFICDGVGARHTQSVTPSNNSISERQRMALSAAEILGAKEPDFLAFPDNQLDTVSLLSIIKKIEETIDDYHPHTIYTHHHGDLNLDHSLVARAVLTACRPQPGSFVKKIYGFEVASSTEWICPDSAQYFIPQRFVALDETSIDAKFSALKAYDFEMRNFPHSRSYEALKALITWRGATVGTKAAEAFSVLRDIED